MKERGSACAGGTAGHEVGGEPQGWLLYLLPTPYFTDQDMKVRAETPSPVNPQLCWGFITFLLSRAARIWVS